MIILFQEQKSFKCKQKIAQHQNEGSRCAASIGQYTIYTIHSTSRQINIHNMQTSMQIMQQQKHANEYANFANQYADYATQATASSFNRIAEYVPGSDVTQHSRLDLDQVTS